jgi:hypothetical protein
MSALTAELALIDISRGQRMWLEAKALIDELSDRFENEDALARRKATNAYTHDAPAYWTRASYHAQKACALQIAVHETSLPNALRQAYHGGDYIAALDTLIPLNEQSAIAMTVQYAEFGLWRDVDELLSRREVTL